MSEIVWSTSPPEGDSEPAPNGIKLEEPLSSILSCPSLNVTVVMDIMTLPCTVHQAAVQGWRLRILDKVLWCSGSPHLTVTDCHFCPVLFVGHVLPS
ncbi:hypothetical protein MHYP_G00095380 [Metynnis hypsauchen]